MTQILRRSYVVNAGFSITFRRQNPLLETGEHKWLDLGPGNKR
jgi:hypothetical protein